MERCTDNQTVEKFQKYGFFCSLVDFFSKFPTINGILPNRQQESSSSKLGSSFKTVGLQTGKQREKR